MEDTRSKANKVITNNLGAIVHKLNQYQINVLGFFKHRSSLFTDWLKHDSTVWENSIVNLLKMGEKFIDSEIRSEMSLYDIRSERYNYLIDMLIEVNLPVKEKSFSKALTQLIATTVATDENI